MPHVFRVFKLKKKKKKKKKRIFDLIFLSKNMIVIGKQKDGNYVMMGLPFPHCEASQKKFFFFFTTSELK